MEELYTKLGVFEELVSCIDHLYLWKYSEHLELLETSCEEAECWNQVLLSVCSEALLEECRRSRNSILISDKIGFLWIATPKWEAEHLQSIYLLGPVFISPNTEAGLAQALSTRINSLISKRAFLLQLQKLPVISHTTFLMLGTMLHYCVVGERITISDIQLLTADTVSASQLHASSRQDNQYHGGAEYEALLLKMIEEGNLAYREILGGNFYGTVGTLAPGNSIRQFKDEIITAITLYSRAAIRGGLSRETALSLSDLYIQALEAATGISEIGNINQQARDDYIRRVHIIRENPQLSKTVRLCLDYIEQNITSDLTVANVASCTGYAGYYVSSIFHKEMKKSLVSYIAMKKIEYAKLLLGNSTYSIGDIAAALHFSSPSHFGSVFLKHTGMSATKYREQNQKI